MIDAAQRGRSSRRMIGIGAMALFGTLLSACGSDGSATSMVSNQKAVMPVNDKGLWIANGTNVLEYVPAQLASGVNATLPKHAINSSVFGAPQGVTFDSYGDLWVLDPQAMVNGTATPALLEFSAAQLAALASNDAPQPVAIITSPALAFPQQSVFDAQGNQWVSDHNNNAILVFTAAQLGTGGTQNVLPAVSISSGAFNGPLGIVFDGYGDLWIANNGGVPGANGATSAVGTTIVEFLSGHLPAPSAMAAEYTLTPDVTLSDDGQGSIQGPWALVFDAQGNLFSSNANAPFTLVTFSATSREMSGAPVPGVTISPVTDQGNPTLNAPNGICFDNIGDLAAMNSAGAFGVAFYGDQQLTGGMTVPDAFLVGTATTLNAPAGCNFGPQID